MQCRFLLEQMRLEQLQMTHRHTHILAPCQHPLAHYSYNTPKQNLGRLHHCLKY